MADQEKRGVYCCVGLRRQPIVGLLRSVAEELGSLHNQSVTL